MFISLNSIRYKLQIKSNWLLAIAAFYLSIPMNLSLWRFLWKNLDVNSASTFIFAASFPLLIFVVVYLFLNLVALPYLAKPVLIIMIMVSSVANFMMFQYGVYIDSDMVRNVFETNTREAIDLVTLSAAIWVYLTGLVPVVLLFFARIEYRNFWGEARSRALMILLCLLGIALIAAVSYKNYASFGRNNNQIKKLISPTNYIAGTIRYFQKQAIANRPFTRLDDDAALENCEAPYPIVFIMVVGETARSMNFSLNGYPRKTNPRLEKEKIVNFPNVYSCGTATAISVPCMFSAYPRSEFDPDLEKTRENMLDLLQQSGYNVLWRENDNGCKGVCKRIPTENVTTNYSNSLLCNGKSCYDEVLLEDLEDYLGTVKKNTFIVLHAMGSHGPTYYQRYPDKFKQFKPTCDTAELQNCTKEQIVNTYDNTILYTDYVVSETIQILKRFPKYKSGLMYVSDHGESLGENNIFLHGLPYKIAPEEQKRIPLFFWFSENMQKNGHVNFSCAQKAAEKQTYSHDNLFHSILGLMEIHTKLYNPDMDFFNQCRPKPLNHSANEKSVGNPPEKKLH